jgi:hypothetical protein
MGDGDEDGDINVDAHEMRDAGADVGHGWGQGQGRRIGMGWVRGVELVSQSLRSSAYAAPILYNAGHVNCVNASQILSHHFEYLCINTT